MSERRTARGGPGGSRRPEGRTARGAPARPRPAADPAAAATTPGTRRPRLTGRAAVLVLVVAVLTVSYASSLQGLPPAALADRRPQGADRRARGNIDAPRAREAPLGRPGLRAGPGPGAVRLPDARRDVVRRARRERRPARDHRDPQRPRPGGQGRADGVVDDRLGLGRAGRQRRPRPAATSRPPPRSTAPTTSGADRPRRRPRLSTAARPRAARHPRDRAPLPVRPARRGDHRAAAADRHAVPDDLLPHLPAGGVPDRHPRGVRADEGDAGPARRRPRARGGVRRGARALPRRAGRARARSPRSRASRPAGCRTG